MAATTSRGTAGMRPEAAAGATRVIRVGQAVWVNTPQPWLGQEFGGHGCQMRRG